MSSSTILVVDDEKDLAGAVVYNLEKAGYQVVAAYDGATALREADRARPELIVLDVMLPDLSGFEVTKRLRASTAHRTTPILMLTARSEEIDRVVGFEVGADDYLVKPFSMRELVLRVRAILRRNEVAPSEVTERVRFGILDLDAGAHRVWIDGEEARLTALEFKLLELFLARRGRVQTRNTLLRDVWGMGIDVTTRTVDTHVKRLREKLGPAADYVETIRGVGYRFLDAPPETAATAR